MYYLELRNIVKEHEFGVEEGLSGNVDVVLVVSSYNIRRHLMDDHV